MVKKLFVPERIANARKKQAISMEIPEAVKKGFPKIEDNPNSKDPSKLEASALERLPQPVGYRILVIPYYMKSQTKGGVYISSHKNPTFLRTPSTCWEFPSHDHGWCLHT